MRTRLAATCVILLAIGTPASAHRLDEYLQATTISLATDHVQAQIRLTPGVAVFPGVLATMDTNGDGVLSEAEQRSYATRVLRDLALTLDGDRLQLRLVSWKFAKIAEMKEGRGDIQLEFNAQISHSGRNRRLIFENLHQSRIAVYLVNCLVPRDPNIRVTAQLRNYQQSHYELDYLQNGIPSVPPALSGRPATEAWPGIVALFLFLSMPFIWLWRRIRVGKGAIAQNNGTGIRTTVSQKGSGV